MDRAKNLNECFVEFAACTDDDSVEQIRQMASSQVIQLKYGLEDHFGLADKSSRLVKYFESYSILEADEMAETIAYGFWLHINSKPCEIEDVIELRSQLQGQFQDLPKDLNECYSVLRAELSEELLDDLRMTSENELEAKYHFGLGASIRNNFGLWGVTPLTDLFISQEIDQPDEMSTIILHGFWLLLHSQPCDFESVKQAVRKARGLPN